MKTNTLSALFVIVMAMGFTLNEAFGGEVKILEATFEQVSTACDNTEGCDLTIRPDGSYSADTNDSWIDCDSDGNCIGANVDAKRSSAVIDWNKATKTTFVGVMSPQSKRQANCPNILSRVRVLDQKSQALIAKLSPGPKSTAVKSLIRRSRSATAKTIRIRAAAKGDITTIKKKARVKALGRQKQLAALTSQLKRNTKQRKNLWRQCKIKVGSSMQRQTPDDRPKLAAPFIPGGAIVSGAITDTPKKSQKNKQRALMKKRGDVKDAHDRYSNKKQKDAITKPKKKGRHDAAKGSINNVR